MNILYVENHAVFAQTIKLRFLSQHIVTIVPSLIAARQAASQVAFDLFLIDYDLDDGKGDQFVVELRSSGNRVPIIAVSSHEAGNRALVVAGATAICAKTELDQIETLINSLRGRIKTT